MLGQFELDWTFVPACAKRDVLEYRELIGAQAANLTQRRVVDPDQAVRLPWAPSFAGVEELHHDTPFPGPAARGQKFAGLLAGLQMSAAWRVALSIGFQI
jgi:hypothetical protein